MLTPARCRVTRDASGEIRMGIRAPRKLNASRTPLQSGVLSSAKRALSSNAKNSENIRCIRSGRGSVPRVVSYTKYAKRQIKNGVAALKDIYGKSVLFLTVTIPGSTDEALLLLARYSATFVDSLRHWLQYQAPRSAWVYKWEWQKRGALHLHAALGCANRVEMEAIRRKFKREVYSLFVALSDRVGQDIFQRADGTSWRESYDTLRIEAKPVRKCVKRYMAKYVSKCPGADLGYHPSRWWGATRALMAHAQAKSRASTRSAHSALELRQLELACLGTLARYTPVLHRYGNPIFHEDVTYIAYIDDKYLDSAWENLTVLVENFRIQPPVATVRPLLPEWW